MISRWVLISMMAGGLLAAPLAAEAQQPAMPVIGFLSSGSADEWEPQVAGFRQGLNETGYVEGRDFNLEYRWAQGRYDRLPALASDLVQRQATAIFTSGGFMPVQAAKAATNRIPIVFVSGNDPVQFGLVASLNRPGGNITGVSWLGHAMEAKRLELLSQLAPAAAVIAVLLNPNNPSAESDTRDLSAAARAVGRRLLVVRAATERDLDTAFAILVQQKARALLVVTDPFLSGRRAQLVALASRHAVPAIYSSREWAAAGGLLSYGPDVKDAHRLGGVYVGRILKGAKPADLPVEQPTKFELVINLKTAKALGLTIPPSLLGRADEVIQ